jgi:hypothetical protein
MPWGKNPGTPFCRVKIVSVTWEEYPGESIRSKYDHAEHPELLAENDVEGRREGFDSWGEFWETYMEINGPGSYGQPCHRVAFELVRAGEV